MRRQGFRVGGTAASPALTGGMARADGFHVPAEQSLQDMAIMPWPAGRAVFDAMGFLRHVQVYAAAEPPEMAKAASHEIDTLFGPACRGVRCVDVVASSVNFSVCSGAVIALGEIGGGLHYATSAVSAG